MSTVFLALQTNEETRPIIEAILQDNPGAVCDEQPAMVKINADGRLVVRRETIEDALYNFNEPVTPNAVEAAVSRLRRRLDEAGATGALHTIRGVGYMLKDVAA